MNGAPNKSLTKKGGAGRWNVGRLDDYTSTSVLDRNDPNYDPDEAQEGYVLEASE